MQCALAAHKLNVKQGRNGGFIFILQDVYTRLLQYTSILERNPSSIAINNIARLTGRNHWPVKRETPEEWKAMKSKNQNMQSMTGKRKIYKGWKTHKTTWVCKGCPGEPGLSVEKECFALYHTQFDFSV